MENKTFEKIFAVVSALLIIGIIFSALKFLNKKTETNVISERGLDALKDRSKKDKINEAIEKAKKSQEETGIWNDPVVDLS